MVGHSSPVITLGLLVALCNAYAGRHCTAAQNNFFEEVSGSPPEYVAICADGDFITASNCLTLHLGMRFHCKSHC